MNEIKLLGGTRPVISTNIPVRLDGQLYATLRPVNKDHGVAVYFIWNNKQRVIACDSYPKIEDNLRAIELTIEGIRRPERYGIADAINSAFERFKLIGSGDHTPAPVETWWRTLEVSPDASLETITKAFHALAKLYHPDMRPLGNKEKFQRIKAAYDEAIKSKLN
ncbi:J domain-containing protein [Mucilaginibacter sp. Bleaf8]|uniref:J domain-containing protein n=1 Tax=Mucilaginibacter sp. Bleaf8 TaxID=2834430 RepID=UPI001BD0ECC9|nr:J domain-containing protein [Mucilaginibacter sp. Bleaf8]MBS7565109.1 J domain-containing protein [Mucilaginibacter sp. Bleaf8]